MTTYYISSIGNDTNDGTQAAPFATLQRAANAVENVGGEVRVAPGVYQGAAFWGEFAAGASLSLIGGPGVQIRTPNKFGQGLRIENWGGTATVEGFDIEGMPDDGMRLTTIRRAEVWDCAVRGSGEINIHLPYCLGGVIERVVSTGAIRQHGLYLANSGGAENGFLVRKSTFHDNAACGVQMNGDATMDNGITPVTGFIDKPVIEENDFGGNGRLGGSDVNCDAVRDGIIRNNAFSSRAGRGSIISFFHSDTNQPGRNLLVTGNTVKAGSMFSILALSDPGATVRGNVLVRLDYPGNPEAAVIEFFAPVWSGTVFEWNAYRGSFVTPDGIKTLAELGFPANNVEGDVLPVPMPDDPDVPPPVPGQMFGPFTFDQLVTLIHGRG